MVYPADYGFLVGHRGSDGDPLDRLVCVSEATFPGCVIPVNPVAMFEMKDEAAIPRSPGSAYVYRGHRDRNRVPDRWR
jgi:hypothetical protein